MNGSFFDKLNEEDGILRADGARYVLIRADGLMGCFKPGFNTNALSMYKQIEDSFFCFGGKSTQAYADTLGEAHGELLQKIEETAPQLGWGKWLLSLSEGGRTLSLKVEHSPFSAGYGHANFPVCAPVAGMLRAVAERILGQSVTCIEHRCSAMGGGICEFEASIESATNSSGPA